MITIFIAGHETTGASFTKFGKPMPLSIALANSISWTLLELSRHPEMQSRLREEIRAKKRDMVAKGNTARTFAAEDFDTLPYLNAVLKESLRYHSVASQIQRMANVDDVIPLSEPILTSDGQYISEVPVRKGQKVWISISGYNRNKSVFGEDAHEFNPDRWLNNLIDIKPGSSVGVYANL
ncbi:hypothetical protein VNI00_008617 [Paramarasmius palmivorus]|uniref:Cytochrome P450 n=1 Tax=Paramarasmius palmivorus TaxID=297713 RepID=A0AAW0CTM9_9AGAR